MRLIKTYLKWCLPMVVISLFVKLFFVLLNSTPTTSFSTWYYLVSAGFDVIALFYLSLPFILGLIFLSSAKVLHQIGHGYRILLMLCILILGAIDIFLYSIQHHHLNAHHMPMVLNEWKRVPSYILDYLLPFFILLVLVVLIIKYLPSSKPTRTVNSKSKWTFIGFVLLLFVAVRGGSRLRPLTTSDISLFIPPAHVPMYESFPLLFVESLNEKPLPEVKWLNDIDSPQLKRTAQYSLTDSSVQRKNIVLILVESLGEEYTALNHGWGHTYTPKLNQWLGRYPPQIRYFSNGTKSIHAIPSLYQGLPNWFNQPIIYQTKSNIQMKSTFDLLHEQGYNTTFLHGGDNNTMGFRSYLYALGLDQYLGKDELHTNGAATNTWGLHDEVLFDHFARHIDTLKEPFFSSLFTLSSHHPYTYPRSFSPPPANQNLPIHNVLAYTDSCLGDFLNKIDFNNPKVANTVFIITADHSSINQLHAYRTESGKYEVPFLLISKDTMVVQKKVGSHYDILPTLLDISNYSKPFFSFGSTLLQPSSKPVINYDGQRFSVIHQSTCLVADMDGPIALYDDRSDPNHLNNLINKQPELREAMFNILKREFSDLKWRVENNFFE